MIEKVEFCLNIGEEKRFPCSSGVLVFKLKKIDPDLDNAEVHARLEPKAGGQLKGNYTINVVLGEAPYKLHHLDLDPQPTLGLMSLNGDLAKLDREVSLAE